MFRFDGNTDSVTVSRTKVEGRPFTSRTIKYVVEYSALIDSMPVFTRMEIPLDTPVEYILMVVGRTGIRVSKEALAAWQAFLSNPTR